MNQTVRWSERQDLNLPRPIEIAQGDSDKQARPPGKALGNWPAILTLGLVLALAACAPPLRPLWPWIAAEASVTSLLRGTIDANGNDAVRR